MNDSPLPGSGEEALIVRVGVGAPTRVPVSAHLPLSDVRRAHERLEQGGGGKIILTI
jgi:hypothetical protein